MSARRFAEWQAYAQLEPFGPPAAFWQAAMIASIMANVNRDPKKQAKAYQPEDFMPKAMTQQEPGEIDPEQAGRAIASRFQALAELHARQGGLSRHGE